MASDPPPDPVVPAAPAPPVAAPSAKALSCPACGGALEVRAAGYTVTIVCRYCSSVIDVANPEARLITKYEEAVQELELPLGTRGTLRGVEWEVIGYLRRSEHGAYGWEEYLLFNPYYGYRWLITNGRGWSFGEMLTRAPDWQGTGPQLDGKGYSAFFSNGQAQVDYVLGEFYWRVQVGEEVATDDYVRPGWMLSREANAAEISWTLSELLDPAEMESAFGISAPRDAWPPLPHQPSPYARPLKAAAKIGAIAALLLIVLAFVFGGSSVLYENSLPVMFDGQTRTQTLGPITVTRPWQMVAIRADAGNIDNAWVDLDYTLVDRATQETYESYGLAEHYSGSDSDGPWEEGSRDTTAKVAMVPAGTYDLVVESSGNLWTGSSYGSGGGGFGGDVRISVSQGLVFPVNVIIALVLLLLPVLFLFVRHMRFEKARQGESDVGGSSGSDDSGDSDDSGTDFTDMFSTSDD